MRRLLLLVHVPDAVRTIEEAWPYLRAGGYVVAMPTLEHEGMNRLPAENRQHLHDAFEALTCVLPEQYGGEPKE